MCFLFYLLTKEIYLVVSIAQGQRQEAGEWHNHNPLSPLEVTKSLDPYGKDWPFIRSIFNFIQNGNYKSKENRNS